MPCLTDNGIGVLEPGEALLLNGQPIDAGFTVECFRVSERETDRDAWVLLRHSGHALSLRRGTVFIQPAGA